MTKKKKLTPEVMRSMLDERGSLPGEKTRLHELGSVMQSYMAFLKYEGLSNESRRIFAQKLERIVANILSDGGFDQLYHLSFYDCVENLLSQEESFTEYFAYEVDDIMALMRELLGAQRMLIRVDTLEVDNGNS